MDTNGHIRLARMLTEMLDNKFGVGKFKFGLDPIVGAVPGLGDIITTAISLYIVWIGVQLRMPQEKIAHMISNVVADFIIGIIPVVGDIADVFYHSNSRNMKIIDDFLATSVIDGQVIK